MSGRVCEFEIYENAYSGLSSRGEYMTKVPVFRFSTAVFPFDPSTPTQRNQIRETRPKETKGNVRCTIGARA
jgi:hypothetical protein